MYSAYVYQYVPPKPSKLDNYWMIVDLFSKLDLKMVGLKKKGKTLLSTFWAMKAPFWIKLLSTGLKKTPCSWSWGWAWQQKCGHFCRIPCNRIFLSDWTEQPTSLKLPKLQKHSLKDKKRKIILKQNTSLSLNRDWKKIEWLSE